ncbi:MAG: MFS transporter, partial [Acidobacteriaceae bacterium]|nr:MFS transporter [Acidobacteriaceae bacterium]
MAADSTAVRKAFRRLIPLLMLFYILAYVDRVNIGFAALTMNPDLGLTATMFGVASSCFFVTYVAFEVPSNILMARIGARIWIPRILISWGLVSALTMFVTNAYQLYGLRALLGLAEAGLFPGVLYYLSTWFPDEARARANGLFMAALPLALLVGAPISGFALQMDGWLGLKGWQWLFLVEGVPSIVTGIIALFVLPNRPSDVRWLSDAEKHALQERLAIESDTAGANPKPASVWREVLSPGLLAFGMVHFCTLTSMSVLGTWTPLIIKELLGTGHISLVAFLAALPPLTGILAIVANGAHSDRTNERVWHTCGALAA